MPVELEKSDKTDEKLEFSWGKKKGRGGMNKKVQFYESFKFDGVEYSLYDSVYLYKAGESEPYVGKLLKIWGQPVDDKKIKILWFFRPSEIANHLQDVDVLENELFLGTGEGIGLANINPLEAIAGKCNVVCISKDSRNRQPSAEELKMADHIFYRTFDVKSLTISDKLDEKIAMVDVKMLLNKNNRRPADLPELHNVNTEEKLISADAKPLISAEALLADCSAEKLGTAISDKTALDAEVDKKEISNNVIQDMDVDVKSKPSLGVSMVKEDTQSKETGDDAKPINTSVVRSTSKQVLESGQKTSLKIPDIKKTEVRGVGEGVGKAPQRLAEAAKSNDRVKLSRERDGTSEGLSKKRKSISLSEHKLNDKLGKVLKKQPNDAQPEAYNKVIEVTQRPSDKSGWFTASSWDDRMKFAYEKERLVLLQNLDPTYSSSEVENIVWHGFGEHCTVKIVQRTTTSSPHSGQALAIFNKREDALKVITKLEKDCMMLPNGRPLVGTIHTMSLPGKQSQYSGHIVIDKPKHQMQKEMKDAVSTSHSSQANTIEYELALEWRLLQERSDLWWKILYQKQGEEVKKLKACLKSQ